MHKVNGQFILLDEFFRIGLWKDTRFNHIIELLDEF